MLIMLVITVVAIALLFSITECTYSAVVRNSTSQGAVDLLACEQALCLGKKIAREGKGGERACRQTFEAAIPPYLNYLAEHLSVRSLSVNQFRV